MPSAVALLIDPSPIGNACGGPVDGPLGGMATYRKSEGRGAFSISTMRSR
jgi:hypothetical protein